MWKDKLLGKRIFLPLINALFFRLVLGLHRNKQKVQRIPIHLLYPTHFPY